MSVLTDRIIAGQERAVGADLEYLRSIADTSPAAFAKFGLAGPLLSHRKYVPAAAWHLARLAATRVQDCGTCVQIVVNAALADGVPAATLRVALDSADGSSLAPDESLALRFGDAVARSADGRDALIAEVREAFGDAGHVELALAVATVQLFPMLKRGLGQDVACRLVHVEV